MNQEAAFSHPSARRRARRRHPAALSAGLLAVGLLGAPLAQAQVAPECSDFAGPPPVGYDEQTQHDFIANRSALLTTLSPLHGPIPHAPGRAGIGVDLLGQPPMGCEQRFVDGHRRTYDTTRIPVLVRPRITVALPAIGPVIPYFGAAYVPPIHAMGRTTQSLAAELGFGFPIGEHLQLGLRGHASTTRTVAVVVPPKRTDDPTFDDLFVGSTFGADLLVGWQIGQTTPYLSGGFTDASTFFYIGDDDQVINNLHPYFGPTFTLGVDTLIADTLRLAVEAYAAPGGYSTPDPNAASYAPFSRYGHLYTGRIRLAWEL